MPTPINNQYILSTKLGGPGGDGSFTGVTVAPFYMNMGFGPNTVVLQTIDLSAYTQLSVPPSNFTGSTWGGIYVINDTDTSYVFNFIGGTAQSFTLAPGDKTNVLIPLGATSCQLTAMYQNFQQAHPMERIAMIYFSQADIDNGWAGIDPGGGTANPSVPAGSILPGALPEGVTIGANDVGVAAPNETFGAFAFLNPAQINAGTFPAGVLLPAGQVSAGTLIGTVHETQINSDGGLVTTDGNGNLKIGNGADSNSAGTPALSLASNGTLMSVYNNPGDSAWSFVPQSAGGVNRGLAGYGIDSTGTLHEGWAIDGSSGIVAMTAIEGFSSNDLPITAFNPGRVNIKAGAALQSDHTILLAHGNQESGVSGGGAFISQASGAVYFSTNFKTTMTNTPSSITFSGITSGNLGTGPTVDSIDVRGFLAHITASLGGQNTFWWGTYTTVGN